MFDWRTFWTAKGFVVSDADAEDEAEERAFAFFPVHPHGPLMSDEAKRYAEALAQLLNRRVAAAESVTQLEL